MVTVSVTLVGQVLYEPARIHFRQEHILHLSQRRAVQLNMLLMTMNNRNTYNNLSIIGAGTVIRRPLILCLMVMSLLLPGQH